MEDTLRDEIEHILIMFSELKVIFDSVNYPGNITKAKSDVTFKGFCETSELEFNNLVEEVIHNFGSNIYHENKNNKQEMLPIYKEMYFRYKEKRTASIFNRTESTENERKEFIDYVVYGTFN